MEAERWQKLKEAFGHAIDSSDGTATRAADDCLGDDAELRGTFDRLVERSGAAEAFEVLHARLAATVEETLERDAESAGLAHGTVIDGFTIDRLIGVGGMGEVYRARQASTSRDVAVKILTGSRMTRHAAARLEAEARILARLDHPAIGRVITAGTLPLIPGNPRAAGMPFLAMELVEGVAIGEYVKAGALDVRRIVELFIPVCEAVEHAHRRLVIHRDLKPANILVDRAGHARVLDFGISRATDDETRITQIDAGFAPGTPEYMSPEHASGDSGAVETRSDVYCLGAVLYELVTGRRSIAEAGRSRFEYLRAIREEVPAPARKINPLVPRELSDILAAALEKDPQRRYQSAGALADDLGRFLRYEPLSIRPAGLWTLLATRVRRNKAQVVTWSVVGCALIALAGFGVNQKLKARAADGRSELMTDLIVNETRKFVVGLNEELRAQGQPLEARRTVLEHAAAHLAGLRERAGDDPRVLEAIADTYVRLGMVVGGSGRKSMGETDSAMKLFDTAVGLYRTLLAVHDTDSVRLGLSNALEQVGISKPGAPTGQIIGEAAAHVEVVAQRAAGPDAESLRLRALRLRLIVSTESNDPEGLRRVIAGFSEMCNRYPDSWERWGELGLAQRYLCELLVPIDREGSRAAALACRDSLRRSIALGGDDFSNHRHLATNELTLVSLDAGIRPAEELIPVAVSALESSRRQFDADPTDNFRRLSHVQRLLAFVHRGLDVARAVPPADQKLSGTDVAARFATLAQAELDSIARVERGTSKEHPGYAPVVEGVKAAIAELRAIAGANGG